MTLQNTVALITGGTSGLGLAVAKELLEKGCTVHVIGRSEANITAAKKEIQSPHFHTHQADVVDPKAVAKVVTKIGSIDILINSAGVFFEGTLQEHSLEMINATIDVNLKGTIFTTHAVLPGMLKANAGFIINVSSTSGLKGKEIQSIYVASKYGVRGFTESLQLDLVKTNIKVVGFYPGGMNTNLFKKNGVQKDVSTWMSPAKVAHIIVFMLEQDDTMVMDHVVVNKRLAKMG